MKVRTLGQSIDSGRRRLLGGLALLGGLLVPSAQAAEKKSGSASERFPGDPPENFVVYQINKPDGEYHDHIVFSIGAMQRQYKDNIQIAVVAFGPGVHVLLKNPRRPVSQTVRERLASLSDYGVEFFACGNTLKSLKLDESAVVPYAKVVEVGAAKLMELQKQGYSYISW